MGMQTKAWKVGHVVLKGTHGVLKARARPEQSLSLAA